jgi:uncharacterized membrane protein (UPF0127 family)
LTIETKLIVNLTRGECLCVGELADRPLRRMRGLIGHEGLPAGEGLLLRPAPSIHTAFLRFPIDAVFLDDDLRVLEIVERLRPWRVAAKRRARAVLELAAGESARRGVRVGDRLSLRDRKPARAVAKPPPQPEQVEAPKSSDSIIWPPSLAQGVEPARVPPRTVLIASEDRHFRSVTTMLLSHRGCSVRTTANVSGLAELLAHKRVDAVVLDTGSSPAATQLAIASVQGIVPRVGVVLVSELPLQGPSQHPVVEKWGPFADLFDAIERASECRSVGSGNGAGH